MKARTLGTLVLVLLAKAMTVPSAAMAAAEISTEFMPEARYTVVNGYADKFRVHHWINPGFDAGVGEFLVKTDDMGNGYSLWNEGHFFPGNADYFYELKVKKEDEAYADVLFQQFRKYYDSVGGVYPNFERLRIVDSDRDLYVDMGKIEVILGLTPPNLPDIEFVYEYEYKLGVKSRTTWAGVTEGTTKKTGPVWQEIDEEVNVFELNFHDNWNGTFWKADQRWEHFETVTTREEKDISVNSTVSERKIRDHILKPKADLFTSVIELKRYFFKDKVLATGGYRYSQIETAEVERIMEMNESRVLANTSGNPHQVIDSPSTSQYSAHTGVSGLFWSVTKDLILGVKGKYETIKKNGQSTLMSDNISINGISDQNDVNNTSSDIERFGEHVTLRYSGIPNLVLYNDVEFEQTDNDLYEDRQSRSSGEIFSRYTINRAYRGANEAGFNYHPNSFLLWSTQYRVVRDNIDYDDQFETLSTNTAAKSAFMDAMQNETHQVTTRATMDFCTWFKPTVRYQYRDFGYTTRFETADLDLRSDTIAHIYTADLPVQITPELSVTGSYQFQDVVTVTPANEQNGQSYAPFHGDVGTWMASADYYVSKDVQLNATAQFQQATNVMDYNTNGIPFGADYDKVDLQAGINWRLSKTVVLEPRYEYYYYSPNQNIEYGRYNAHTAWVGVSVEWA